MLRYGTVETTLLEDACRAPAGGTEDQVRKRVLRPDARLLRFPRLRFGASGDARRLMRRERRDQQAVIDRERPAVPEHALRAKEEAVVHLEARHNEEG